MTPVDKHNELAVRFVREVVVETKSWPDMALVIETVMLTSMLALSRTYGTDPSVASGIVEAALHRATERFAQVNKKP